MESTKAQRRNDLDWLRVLAILVVFIYHASRFFNLGDWHVKNPATYFGVEVWNVFATTWMMPLIFTISGASLFFALEKGGAGRFLKAKVLRLLIPLLVGVFTHASLQVYLERLTHGQFSGSYFAFLPYYFMGIYEEGNAASGNFAFHGLHLWYLLFLFIFSFTLYPLLCWLKRGGQGVLNRLGAWLSYPGAVYTLALPVILLKITLNPEQPPGDINAGGWNILAYACFFLSGFLIISHPGLEASIRKQRWHSLGLGVGLMATYLLLWAQPVAMSFGSSRFVLVSGIGGLSAWCWLLAIWGFGTRHLNFRGPFLGYANEAVMGFYILHQPVLLCVGYFVVGWAIPDVLKYPLVAVPSFFIIMGLYEFLVRKSKLMRLLFGMKWVKKRTPQRRSTVMVPEGMPRGASNK